MKQNEHGMDNGKRKFHMAAEKAAEFFARLDDLPPVLAGKAVRLLLLSILILFIGMIYGIRMKDGICIMMSVLLFLALLWYFGSLLYIALTKAYETVEGTVIKIQRRVGFLRKLEVDIEKTDGSRRTLLLENGSVLQPDQAYLFYIATGSPDELASLGDTGSGRWIRSQDAVLGFERIRIQNPKSSH
ncbi:MAG: hypothetical protein LUI87_16145 [Lachnospiraceae bacterium]|nr:hypothetical protein [Lachnospiraceae bacterium]